MTTARELLEPGPEKITLSSGVTVEVLPFPAGLWSALQAKALKDFPDPVPPKKTIKVVDGTEEIDDLNDPAFVQEEKLAKRQRNNMLGEAVMDLCILVNLELYSDELERLGKYLDLPEDRDELRLVFLAQYALRTRGDYEAVMVSATTQMMVSDPDVVERLKFFRREVEGTTAAGADASGAAEEERVDLQPEAEGA